MPGASRCRYGQECFAEEARDAARRADVVVTNHALLAIDALENRHILPEHDAVVIDEAHELVARVTGVATDDLTAYAVEKAARRCRPHVDDEAADALLDAGEHLRETLDAASPGRIDSWPPEVAPRYEQSEKPRTGVPQPARDSASVGRRREAVRGRHASRRSGSMSASPCCP